MQIQEWSLEVRYADKEVQKTDVKIRERV